MHQQLQQFFYTYFDQSDDLYAVVNGNGILQFANSPGKALVHLPYMGEPFINEKTFGSAENCEAVSGLFQQVRNEGKNGVADLSVATKGPICHLGVHIRPVTIDNEASYYLIRIRDENERALADRDLRESRKNYKVLVDQAPMGIIVHQGQQIVFANDMAFEMAKARDRDQLLGRNPLEFVHPDYQDVVKERVRLVMKKKEPTPTIEEVFLDADGNPFNVETNANYVEFDGQPAVQVTFIEISDRKLAEKKLKEERDKAERYLNVASSIILVLDANGTIERINRKGQIVLGYSARDLEGQSWFDKCVPEKYRNRYRESFTNFLEKKVGSNYLEGIVMTKMGDTRLIGWYAHLMKDGKGEISGIILSGQDISEEKRNKQLLEKRERSLNEAQKIAKLGSWEWSLETGQLEISDQVLDILDLDEDIENIAPRDLFRFLVSSDREHFKEDYKKALRGVGFDNFEYQIETARGNSKLIDGKISQIHSSEGKVIGYKGTIQDVTESKKNELDRINLIKQLTSQNKDLEEFAYVVSHNLRSPVASILGLVDLARDTGKTDQLREILTRLHNTANDLDEIIQDLNHILSYRKGGTDPKEHLNLEKLFNSTRRVLHQEMEKTDARLQGYFEEAPTVFAVKSYMNNIFYNLLHNAIKYRKPEVPPEVTITSYNQNGSVVLQFSDNGIGIDLEKHRNTIFGLYQRFHNHTDGKGLGLYLVKSQVETMGGNINVESEEMNGTTFEVILPK